MFYILNQAIQAISVYLGLSLVAYLSIMVYLNTLTMLLAFVKLQDLTAISCSFDPLPGGFENRGSYIEFLGQELLSGPAVYLGLYLSISVYLSLSQLLSSYPCQYPTILGYLWLYQSI